jgi:hypothetical protein
MELSIQKLEIMSGSSLTNVMIWRQAGADFICNFQTVMLCSITVNLIKSQCCYSHSISFLIEGKMAVPATWLAPLDSVLSQMWPPIPNSTRIQLLVTEMKCVNGHHIPIMGSFHALCVMRLQKGQTWDGIVWCLYEISWKFVSSFVSGNSRRHDT